jgi:type IV pilus assembly protein PilQ
VSRRGSLLLVDFARGGAVAATPPVLADDASDPAAATPAARLASGAPATPVPTAGGTILAAAAAAPAQPASLEPPAAIGILEEGGLFDGKEYTGRRISLDFKDVEIADVLRLIAEVSDLNVIAGDEVSGRVTIRLVDVPWDQALDVILLTKSLGFMRVGNVLRVAPSEVIKQEEELRLQERRAKEKLEDLVVKLQPVNYASVKDIEKMVKKLLSPRGSVNIDLRTNTLILKDIPSVIDEATALVKAIDTQTPQVMIEAKIVEANLDFSREFGAVWSFGAQPLVDGFDASSGARTDLGNDAFRMNTTSALGNNAQFVNPITAAPTALFNLAGFVLDEKLNLDLQLQAAEVNGDGKVISSPRVVTLDNSKAEIEQGVSIPFQTFENGDAQLEFVDAVLKLEVTPHITADRSIIMEVQVSRNAPDDSVFTATGSPAIAKNEVETETLVKDGQTLVLGGIYVVDKSARQSRVPYLHRIPLLGAAFRSDEVSDSRKELLIFVTPHVVVVPQAAS